MDSQAITEYVTCNLCGADDAAVMFRVPTPVHYGTMFDRKMWDVVRCRACELIYVNPRLNRDSLNEFYRFENPEDHALVQEWFVDGADMQASTWRRYLRAIHRHQLAHAVRKSDPPESTYLGSVSSPDGSRARINTLALHLARATSGSPALDDASGASNHHER